MLEGLFRSIYRVSPGFVRREVRRKAPWGVDRFSVTSFDGARLQLQDPSASTVLANLWWDGILGYEPETLRLFSVLAKDVDVVYDVGAYFGLYALVAAVSAPRARVFAFEPFPDSFQLQKALIKLNSLEDRIMAIQAAVSDKAGRASYHYPSRAGGRIQNIGSLHNRFEEGERFADRAYARVDVEVTTIDDLVAQGTPAPGLIKIDVEESEHRVLEGAAHTLGACRPDIIMEVIFGRTQLSAIAGRLKGLGYRFYNIYADRVEEVASLSEEKVHAGESRLSSKRGGWTDRLLSTRPAAEIDRLLAACP